jgi:hypothetical protein
MGYGLDSRGADYRSSNTISAAEGGRENEMSEGQFLHQHQPPAPEVKAAARAEEARLKAVVAEMDHRIAELTRERMRVEEQRGVQWAICN